MNYIFLTLIAIIASCWHTFAIDLTACNSCDNAAGQMCVLLPAPGDPEPCYQGTNSNAQVCFNTDPFIVTASYSWTCGLCSKFKDGRGKYYDVYEQNDPVYVNMELWDVNNVEPIINGDNAAHVAKAYKTRKI